MKPQNRKDKIQLLKDLHQRKISLSDLLPETIIIWYCRKGIYVNGELKLTESEFEDYTSKRPRQRNIIYKLQEGNEPLMGEEDE
jgi:hypothetical protein